MDFQKKFGFMTAQLNVTLCETKVALLKQIVNMIKKKTL